MFIKRGENTIEDVFKRNIGMPVDVFFNEKEPFVKNLKEAADAIQRAVKDGAKVSIVGDYDSDGVNATAILVWMFRALGVEPVTRIPKRFSEGYGLNPKIIDEIDDGLLITVDNGIAAAESIKKAKEKGLYVIVIDHHLARLDEDGDPIYPEADIIVDPHIDDESEFEDYCGAGLAYRLAKIMLPDRNLDKLLSFASIATVTDVMPLYGANRYLVKEGLKTVNKNKVEPGLKCLIDKLGLTGHVTETDYGFGIGPVINASGRLYDNGASRVLKTFIADRNDIKNPIRVDNLLRTNDKRKEFVKQGLKNVLPMVEDRPIVVYDSSIGEGIIGIIAGKLCEKYECPCIVFTDSDKPGILKGSGRSIKEVHLKNVLDSIQDKIVGYGGHAGAAGLSIEKSRLNEFSNAFAEACGELPDVKEDVEYDLDLDLEYLSETMEELKRYAPYGEGNPKILFHLVHTPRNTYQTMGDGSHFCIKDDVINIVGFGMTDEYREIGCPKRIDAVGYLNESYDSKGVMSYNFEIVAFNKKRE